MKDTHIITAALLALTLAACDQPSAPPTPLCGVPGQTECAPSERPKNPLENEQ